MKNDITSPAKPLTEFQKIKESAKSIANQEAAEGSYSWMDVYVGCLEANIRHLIDGKAGVERKLDMILERLEN